MRTTDLSIGEVASQVGKGGSAADSQCLLSPHFDAGRAAISATEGTEILLVGNDRNNALHSGVVGATGDMDGNANRPAQLFTLCPTDGL